MSNRNCFIALAVLMLVGAASAPAAVESYSYTYGGTVDSIVGAEANTAPNDVLNDGLGTDLAYVPSEVLWHSTELGTIYLDNAPDSGLPHPQINITLDGGPAPIGVVDVYYFQRDGSGVTGAASIVGQVGANPAITLTGGVDYVITPTNGPGFDGVTTGLGQIRLASFDFGGQVSDTVTVQYFNSANVWSGLTEIVVNSAGAPTMLATKVYTEPFDTDAADAGTIGTTYPDFTPPAAGSVTGGVLNISAQSAMTLSAATASGGAISDFLEAGSSYTVMAEFGATGGAALSYSTQIRFSENAAIEVGLSGTGNEFFRVIADDFGTNTASIGGIPVQVADIGFDILDGDLYKATITLTELGDGSIDLDVTIDDANSVAQFVMTTLNIPVADIPLLLGNTAEVGLGKRGVAAGTAIFDNFSVSFTAPMPIPAPAALPAGLAMLGLVAARRRRK